MKLRRANSRGPTLINILEKKDFIKSVRSRVRSLHEVWDDELAYKHLTLLQIIKDLNIADDDKRQQGPYMFSPQQENQAVQRNRDDPPGHHIMCNKYVCRD